MPLQATGHSPSLWVILGPLPLAPNPSHTLTIPESCWPRNNTLDLAFSPPLGTWSVPDHLKPIQFPHWYGTGPQRSKPNHRISGLRKIKMVPTTFSLIEVNELKTPSAKHIKNNHQGNIFYSLPQKLKAKGTYVPNFSATCRVLGEEGFSSTLLATTRGV